MNILKCIEKLKKFDRLVSLKCTGTPNEFAEKLEVSRRTLFDYIEMLKSGNLIEIEYNKERQSYQYVRDGRLVIEFKEEKPINLSKVALETIYGGNNDSFSKCNLFALNEVNFALQTKNWPIN